ncbi:hypothetical protein CISIN_1g0433512mg, partial [Citrus sinensis]
MIVGLGMCIVLLSSYFNISATRSFFQEFNENTDNIISCKTCDMVHDFSQYLSEQLVISSFDEKIKRLHISCKMYDTVHEFSQHLSEELFISSFDEKVCHSILTLSFISVNSRNLLQELFGELTCLRALCISNNSFESNNLIKEIPPNVGKLVHLRYLNLSDKFIETTGVFV